jgi:D-glycero-alpha-D-manno-heptose-7-phosphate kinase
MIITRTPFRITLGGGGTDLPSFYGEHGGYVFTMAINKYMYILLNRRSVADRKVVIRYSQVETVDAIDEIKNPLAREALRLHNLRENIELTSIADMPGKAGLGSSGSYLVGILTAIRTFSRSRWASRTSILPRWAGFRCWISRRMARWRRPGCRSILWWSTSWCRRRAFTTPGYSVRPRRC